jgi:hypothetical protein
MGSYRLQDLRLTNVTAEVLGLLSHSRSLRVRAHALVYLWTPSLSQLPAGAAWQLCSLSCHPQTIDLRDCVRLDALSLTEFAATHRYAVRHGGLLQREHPQHTAVQAPMHTPTESPHGQEPRPEEPQHNLRLEQAEPAPDQGGDAAMASN